MTISATPSTAALYSDIAAIPAIAAGFILASDAGAPHILLRRNQKDLKNDEARSHVLSFAPGPSGELQPAPFPWETLQVSAMSPSPSGKFVALVRTREVGGKKEQSLEVWDGGSLVASANAHGDVHGDVYSGDVFSGLEWSPDETKLLYTAEAKKVEAASFWSSKAPKASVPEGVGREFVYKEDWGELATGKRLSRVFVMDIATEQVKAVEGAPEDAAVGQAVWAPCGNIVATTFSILPRRLGVRFYNTRPSRIAFFLAPTFNPPAPPTAGMKTSSCEATSSPSKLRWITPEADWAARSPKFSPDGTRLLFVNAAKSAAHFSCSELKVLAWPARDDATPRVVVPIVETPSDASAFPGLFLAAEQLPRRVWLADSRRIVLMSDWRSQRELVMVDTGASLSDPPASPAAPPLAKIACEGEGSWVLLDVQGDHVLAARSSPSHASSAHLLTIPPGTAPFPAEVCPTAQQALSAKLPLTSRGGPVALRGGLEWTVLDLQPLVNARVTGHADAEARLSVVTALSCSTRPGPALRGGLEWMVLDLQAPDAAGMAGTFDAILVESAQAKEAWRAAGGKGEKMPLVVYPHGGPHSNMGAEFYAGPALLALEGFSVLMVNYRGSTGYGQALDVADMRLATEEALKRFDHLDASRVGACGGSHGGFLSLHLVGQAPEVYSAQPRCFRLEFGKGVPFGAPDVYRAAAVRNPVTNIATMLGSTDIPDCCSIVVSTTTLAN
ncbi:hypothetical protein T484DRAFT_1760956 [Baffinella frigidus]|nr:hypothetical protein T484DRAFT_1760956 [Cryptophyta sp. CCMP2293]